MIICDVIDLENNLPEVIDHFLVCASYEDRCLTAYEYIDKDKVVKTSVFYYKQFREHVMHNAELLKNKFSGTLLEMDNANPVTIANTVIEALSSDIESTKRKKNIVVDISTFTRESLLIILKYILIYKDSFSQIILLYRSAEVSNTLSNIVESVRSVIGYMGKTIPERPTHLIVLSGYEYERAIDIIDNIEPDYISIGYGQKGESISDAIQENNETFSQKLAAHYTTENIKIFTHSLVDIKKLKIQLNSIIAEKPNHNIIIAPLNNKISTVAAGLSAIENSHVQICYSQMAIYNYQSYSKPLNECYIENMKDC